ncbi:MAG: hypothetical protein JWP57_4524, partial [Spirosoma sp.]|nr:hypothetical protein [Spirosoma sp.]
GAANMSRPLGPAKHLRAVSRSPIPPLCYYIAFGGAVAILATGVSGDNLPLTVCAALVFSTLVRLLWTQPPALVFAAGLQFVAIATKLIQANIKGVPINNLSDLGADVEFAAYAALAGLVAMGLGMYVGVRAMGLEARNQLAEDAANWTPWDAFLFCLGTIGLQIVFQAASQLSGGLAQFFEAAGGIQWVGVFILACTCISRQQSYSLLALVLLLEVGIGLTGAHSNFKEVFFVVLIAMLASYRKVAVGAMAGMSVVLALLLVLSAYWTLIKPQYRAFIGTGSPSLEERYEFLMRDAAQVDGSALVSGFDRLADRVAYIDFFAKTMDYVPRVRPHEDGAMLGAAFSHIFQPRLFFPDKPALENDTAVTGRYTGISEYRQEYNASISIGFFGELYIDFGVAGMIFCLAVLGLFYGLTFGYILINKKTSPLINAGLSVMAGLTFWQFERSLPKTVGGAVTTILVVLILRRYCFPVFMRRIAKARGLPRRYGMQAGAP